MAPSSPEPVDALVLYRRAANGDREAFWQLVGRHEKTIFAVAFGVLRDSEKAQDVLHDTYVRAFGTLGTLRSPARLSSWLYSMARNISHEHLRKAERQDKIAAAGHHLPTVISVPDMMIQEEELQLLERCVSTLPEVHRVVLGMKYMDNLSCKEIAEALDIGVEAAKSRLFEARRALRSRMKAAEQPAAAPPAPQVRGVQN